MKMALGTIATGLAAAMMALPAPVTTQSGTGWWDWAAPSVMGGDEVRTSRGPIAIPLPRDRDAGRDREASRDRRGRDARRGEQTRGRQGARRQGQGPPFCRNGGGHPVHGRSWCADKGWSRAGWGDVILRTPRDRRQGAVDQGGLIDVLGDVIFGRIDSQRRREGLTAPLSGRWVRDPGTGADILQIRSGQAPLAELTDLTGDGRADIVLVGSH